MQKLLELASTWLEMHSIFKMLHCWPKGAPIEKRISLGCHLPASIVNVNHIRFSFKQQVSKYSSAIYVMQAGTSWNVCANNAIYTCLLQVWSHSDSLHLKYITMFVSQYDSTWLHLEQHDADNVTQMVIDVKTPWKWKSLVKEISQETNERTKEKKKEQTMQQHMATACTFQTLQLELRVKL